jgi:hypothetical protein
MTQKEVRSLVKEIIIAQGGKVYNYNVNNLRSVYGLTGTQIQNALSYFRFSPQQSTFRSKYNFH